MPVLEEIHRAAGGEKAETAGLCRDTIHLAAVVRRMDMAIGLICIVRITPLDCALAR